MNQELTNFAARLRGLILSEGRVPRGPDSAIRNPQSTVENGGSQSSTLRNFDALALELFALQLKCNPAYRKICAGRKLMPGAVEHWTEIPVVPTAVFKELELTCIPPAERAAVFHSSGTTEQKPSRHFHCAESLAVYEASLLSWFLENVLPDLRFTNYDLRANQESAIRNPQSVIFLTPPAEQAPHSSLVHMFETIRQELGGANVAARRALFGEVAADGSWTLDFAAVIELLSSVGSCPRSRRGDEASNHSGKHEDGASSRRLLRNENIGGQALLLGTAFSFVHLLDYLAEKNLRFRLPPGSRVMETGGYKGRSRTMPKAELHALITERLGIQPENIICEYGMSELSSQGYDSAIHPPSAILHPRVFRFPPWARVQIISPETGREVAEGETGLIRVFDLANVFSVLAIQTEDLGVRRGDGFELIGRAALAEARGCSLMTD